MLPVSTITLDDTAARPHHRPLSKPVTTHSHLPDIFALNVLLTTIKSQNDIQKKFGRSASSKEFSVRRSRLLWNIRSAFWKLEHVDEEHTPEVEMKEAHAIWEVIGNMNDEIRKQEESKIVEKKLNSGTVKKKSRDSRIEG